MEQTVLNLCEFATIAVPAALVCSVAWLYSARQSGRLWLVLVAAWIVYLFGLLHFTSAGTLYDMLRYGCEIRADRINLIPFSDSSAVVAFNVLNVALFVPLGLLVPLLGTKRPRLWKIALMGLAVSLVIEVSQLANLRATDVDDIIMNTLGAIIGCAVYCCLPARWRSTARRQAVSGVVIGCLIAAFAGRFLLFNEMGLASVLFGF